MPEEKRKFTRVSARLLADTELDSEGPGVFGRVRDISLQGAFIEGITSLAEGDSCRVVLIVGEAHEEARIRTTSVVARVEDSGVGVRFEQIDVEGLPHLVRLVLSKADMPGKIAQELDAVLGLPPQEPKTAHERGPS
ncbi:MAG TPA: hypothetical protein DCM05_09485 [Elusimicrobia bacterium]|nr:hypothetical protein [Elusimicrobiota bacterium]